MLVPFARAAAKPAGGFRVLTPAVLLALSGAASTASAQVDFYWRSPVSGLWRDQGHWISNGIPNGLDVDRLYINAAGASYTVSVDRNVRTGHVFVDSPDATLSIASGTLTSEHIEVRAGGLSLTGGSIADTPGQLLIGPEGTLRISGGLGRTISRSVASDGVITLSNPWLHIGTDFVNRGTLILERPGNTHSINGATGGGRLRNEGVLRLAAGEGSIQTPLDNLGSIDVAAGILRLYRSTTHAGDVFIADGATLEIRSANEFAGGSSVSGPGTLDVFSGTTFRTGSTIAEETEVSITSTVTLDEGVRLAPRRMRLAGGTIGGAGDVVVTGETVWSHGVVQGTGVLRVEPDARLELTGIGGRTLGRPLDSSGVIVMHGGSLQPQGISIRNAGVFRLLPAVSGHSLPAGSGAVQFLNEGLFEVVGGTAYHRQPLVNSGTIALLQGELHLTGGGVHSGDVTAGADTLLRIEKENEFLPGAALASDGAVTVVGRVALRDGASLAAEALTITGRLDIDPGAEVASPHIALNGGTIEGDGDLTVTHEMTWTYGTIRGDASVLVERTAALYMSGSGSRMLERPLETRGFVSVDRGNLYLSDTLTVHPGGTLALQSPANATVAVRETSGRTGSVRNEGLLKATGNSALVETPFDNAGEVMVLGGGLELKRTPQVEGDAITGGAWRALGGTLELPAGVITRNRADITLGEGSIAGLEHLRRNEGVLRLVGERTFAAPATPLGLENAGVIDIAPGSTLEVNGAFATSGTLRIEIAGPELAGRVTAAGADLGGTLHVAFAGDPAAFGGQAIDILEAPSVAGAFASVSASGLPEGWSVRTERTPAGLRVRVLTSTNPADFNGDGVVNVNDLLGFLGAFRTQDPTADFNADGAVNVNDLLAYLGAFRAA